MEAYALHGSSATAPHDLPCLDGWLVNRGRDAEAKAVLQEVYQPGFDVDAVIADIKEVIEHERLAGQSVGWGAIFCPTKAFRRMLMVGLATAIAQQVCGIDSIF